MPSLARQEVDGLHARYLMRRLGEVCAALHAVCRPLMLGCSALLVST